MAGRGRQTFEKRQREKSRQERAAAKRARREERKEAKAEDDGSEDDTDDLLERFRILNERHEAGEIDEESFEAEKEELFEALGMQ
ncbi:MAG: hypothetical protein M5U31_12910 [Acidimicrobiia bacterium]|nr:hypothetical protein [Acidimicrobiia bacterium]